MTVYMCMRCGFSREKKSTVLDHVTKKKRCQPIMANVEPTIQEVTIGAAQIASDVNHATTHTTINNHNTINININIHPEITRNFPHQDLSHFSEEFKKKILKEVAKNGMKAAVRALFGKLYFDMDASHNMNVHLPPSKDENAIVWNRRQQEWVEYDRAKALLEMLDEHGQTVREFPDEVSHKVPPSLVKKIDAAYDRDDHMSEDLLQELDEIAIAKSNQNQGVLDPTVRYAHMIDLYRKLKIKDAARARKSGRSQ